MPKRKRSGKRVASKKARPTKTAIVNRNIEPRRNARQKKTLAKWYRQKTCGVDFQLPIRLPCVESTYSTVLGGGTSSYSLSSYRCNLTDMQNFAHFQALFRSYKMNGIKLTFTPSWAQGSVQSTPNTCVLYITKLPNRSSSQPSSRSEFESLGCKPINLSRMRKGHITTFCSAQVYAELSSNSNLTSSFYSSEPAPFLPMSQADQDLGVLAVGVFGLPVDHNAPATYHQVNVKMDNFVQLRSLK